MFVSLQLSYFLLLNLQTPTPDIFKLYPFTIYLKFENNKQQKFSITAESYMSLLTYTLTYAHMCACMTYIYFLLLTIYSLVIFEGNLKFLFQKLILVVSWFFTCKKKNYTLFSTNFDIFLPTENSPFHFFQVMVVKTCPVSKNIE